MPSLILTVTVLIGSSIPCILLMEADPSTQEEPVELEQDHQEDPEVKTLTDNFEDLLIGRIVSEVFREN
eukprot:g14360.t1